MQKDDRYDTLPSHLEEEIPLESERKDDLASNQVVRPVEKLA